MHRAGAYISNNQQQYHAGLHNASGNLLLPKKFHNPLDESERVPMIVSGRFYTFYFLSSSLELSTMEDITFA